MSPRLSVVMIAKNAADLLPDCLASVSWADEIVLLDSGSSDNTVELARRLGVQVHINRDWQGYGIQRQRAQDYATGDYVLMIDTDERVTPELAQSIRSVLAAPKAGAIYSIARRNYFLGRFMRHSGWYPDRVMRLYERDRYRYNDNLVHESLDGQGAQVIELAGDLLHLTCRDFSGFQQKQLAYAAAWAQERHQRGKKTSLAAIFGHTLGAFVKTLLLRGGVMDGKQGWLLAVVNAQYTFNKYTELWALSRGYSEKVSLLAQKRSIREPSTLSPTAILISSPARPACSIKCCWLSPPARAKSRCSPSTSASRWPPRQRRIWLTLRLSASAI